ncbi:TPM domain-containing protein [Candidatus Peribacteria bacterium]|nr:TPM domain-containing protein [Candidatus Peribacteria bacterium]
MKKILLFSLFSFLFSLEISFAEFIVPPPPSSPVYDEVGLLSTEEKLSLENTILSLEKETNHQIGIAIIKNLQGRTIEEAGITLARSW